MSQAAELLAFSDSLWAAFNTRDWDGLFALSTEDYVMRTDPRWPGGGEYRGRENQQRFLEQFLDPWETLRYERTAPPAAHGERMLERGAWVGIGRSTGIEGRIEFSVVTTMRDGLLSSSTFFIDHEDALAFAKAG